MAWKTGRKSKYDPAMCQEIISIMAVGGTAVDFCAKHTISRITFDNWIDIHKDFREAYYCGKQKSEKWHIDFAKQHLATAEGDAKINTSLFSLLMVNKHGWTRERRIKIKGMNESLSTIDKLKKILDSLSGENLTAQEASQLAKVADTFLKLYETEELTKRVEQLESNQEN